MAVFRGRGATSVLLVFWALGILCLSALLAPPALQAQSLPLYTVNHFDDQLRTIDPLIGTTLTSATITLADQTVTGGWGLDKHPTTGQFFAILQVSGARRLVTLETNGLATDIGDTGHKIGAINFRKDSGGVVTLYGIAGNSDPTNPDTLFTLDQTTGAPTLVLAFGNGNMGETVAFNPADGLLYRAYGSGEPNVDQFFVSVDPVTLAVTNLPLTGDTYNQATALTHWAGNIFLLADHLKRLFEVTVGACPAIETRRLPSQPVISCANVRKLSTLQDGVGDTKGLLFSGSPPACPPLAPLYGAANITFDGPSVLYSLDPATGAPTLIGPIGFERVSGIAFNPSGTLYGTGERQDGTNTNVLLTIDPCTGAGTEVGPTGINEYDFGTETDISVRKADGTLFAYLSGGGSGLATLDTSTGSSTIVGFPGLDGGGNGIAFSPGDTLFHADNHNLNALDQDNAAATLVTPLNLSAFVDHECVGSAAVNALDFQPGTGTLFGSLTDYNSCAERQQNFLTTIDTTTGVVTQIGQTQPGLDAIAFAPAAGAPTTITTGSNGSGTQSTVIYTPFALPLQAVVKDSGGNPVPGVSVTFTLPGSGASGTFPGGVLSVVVATDASGVATSPTITANGTVGTFTATGTVSGIATPANYLLTNTLSSSATIATGSNGSGTQSTVIHTPFALPLQAVVMDIGAAPESKVTGVKGNGTGGLIPVPGVTVTFTLPSSGASGTFPGGLLSVQVTTDASGVATSPTITANGTVGGPYTATGTVSGIETPANYSLTNTLSSGATINTGGNGSGSQTTPIHTPFPLPLQAVVKDSGGTPVPGVSVTFTVPSSGPSGTFPGGVLSVQVVTDATGTATSPTLTANGTVGGPYTATGTVSGIETPANYSLTNTLSAGATISTGGNGSGSQSTIIYTPFALPLQAVVKDSGGTPVPGVTVTFTVPSSGASATFPGGLLSVQVTTDGSGVATSPTLTANGTVGGPYTATGTVSGIATPANYSLTNTLSPAATIATGGNGSGTQSTVIHTPFALPLQAVVMDIGPAPPSAVTGVRGNSVGSLVPVPGVKVTFTVPSSGPSGTFPGGVLSVQVVTDATGTATSPTLTANGTVGGPYTATGTVTGIETPANYSLTNTLSAGATIGTGGNGSGSQSTPIRTAFPLPLQAVVKDSGGTPVPGVTVTFAVPSSGPSGTFPGAVLSVQVVTDATGTATSPTLTANGTVGGPYTATGTVTGIATPANYSLTNTPGPASSLAANGGSGQRATVTTAFALPLQVTVRDSDGNLVPGVIVTFTAPGSGASGTFAGGVNTAVTNASGVATSATFTANSASGSYNVNATVPGVATSAAFAMTNVDFSVASTTGTQAVAAGGTANYTLNFIAIADKSINPTTFSCQNLPANSACAFNPPSLPADSGNTPFGLAISTTPRPTTAASVGSGGGFGLPLGVLPAAVLALLAMIAMSLASFSKRAPKFAPARVAAFGMLVLMVGYIAGCGAVGTGFPARSAGVQGTPAGTYTVTVVATSGTLQRTTTVSLTVQ